MLLHRLHRDDRSSWTLMPDLLHRVHVFCEDFDPETLPLDAEDFVRSSFTNGDQRSQVWVATQPDAHKIVGHVWATVEPFAGPAHKYVLIRQAQVDKHLDLRAECRQVFQDVERWTRSFGLSKIMMITHRSETAMYRAWGFQPYKALMVNHLTSQNGDSIDFLGPPDILEVGLSTGG